MKRLNYLGLLGVFLFLMSCKCSHVATLSKSRFVKMDSIVCNSLGDTLSSILFSPQLVNVYSLTTKDSAGREIAGFTIDSLVYSMKPEDLSIFQYSFLCDTMNYRTLHTIRAPFSPIFTFEFIKENANIYLMFSLVNREWRIVTDDKILKAYVFRPLALEQFVSELLPNETF